MTAVAPGGPPEGGTPDSSDRGSGDGSGGSPRRPGKPVVRGGFLEAYKPEQGIYTRRSTFVGLALLIVWGVYFLNDQLVGYQGSEAWRLLVTPGIAIAVGVILGAFAWRVAFVSRKSSDFMIATEGEMKKVSWSSRREVIGSTKVVIVFTALLAILLFTVDLSFQSLFSWLGVLKS